MQEGDLHCRRQFSVKIMRRIAGGYNDIRPQPLQLAGVFLHHGGGIRIPGIQDIIRPVRDLRVVQDDHIQMLLV